MKKLSLLLIAMAVQLTAALALTPRQVLDKCAATVSSANGASASFRMTSAQYGEAQGTISVKGRKFCTQTQTTSMWFDGTTLWTYMAANDEVNVTTPTEQQLQTLNPYNFINLYKEGFTYTMSTSGTAYVVHLTASDAQHKIREAFITVDKSTYAPKEIKMLHNAKWTTFTVWGLKSERLDDGLFRYNPSLHPSAEVIDLR